MSATDEQSPATPPEQGESAGSNNRDRFSDRPALDLAGAPASTALQFALRFFGALLAANGVAALATLLVMAAAPAGLALCLAAPLGGAYSWFVFGFGLALAAGAAAIAYWTFEARPGGAPDGSEDALWRGRARIGALAGAGLSAAALLAGAISAGGAFAKVKDPARCPAPTAAGASASNLEQRVDLLDRRLQFLERQLELSPPRGSGETAE